MESCRLRQRRFLPPAPLLAVVAALFAATPAAGAEEGGSAIGNPVVWRAEAVSFEHGEGVARDVDRAIRLYCQCARMGDADSQYRLGWIYANGRSVERDDRLASYFFALAARQGDADAARMLDHVGRDAAPAPSCMANEKERLAAQEIGSWPDESFGARSPMRQKVAELVNRLAPQYGVVPRLAMAVIQAESNFDPSAVSAKKAQGLMQLIPETAERFNVRKPFDPEQNVRGGLAYLRWLLAYFKGNVALVAAAYNAGEGAVNKYGGIPPYAETRGYVKRIRELFRNEHHPYDPSVVDPSPELPRIRVRTM